MSAIKAGDDGPTDNTKQHGDSDEELAASGLSYTILRPHFFMQNLFFSAPTIASDSVMYWGMGDGKLGMVDARDIAEVAGHALLNPEIHKDKVYTPTGPQSITLYEAAKAIGDELGKEVTYQPVPVEAVVDSIKDLGWGDWAANVMGQYAKAYAEGWGDFTNDDVKDVTGNAPRSIESFAKELLVPAINQG